MRRKPILAESLDRLQPFLDWAGKPELGIARLRFQGVAGNDFFHDLFIVNASSGREWKKRASFGAELHNDPNASIKFGSPKAPTSACANGIEARQAKVGAGGTATVGVHALVERCETETA